MTTQFHNDLTEATRMFASLLESERKDVLEKMREMVKRIPA